MNLLEEPREGPASDHPFHLFLKYLMKTEARVLGTNRKYQSSQNEVPLT